MIQRRSWFGPFKLQGGGKSMLALGLMGVALSGCATGSDRVRNDHEARAKSRVYLEGMKAGEASSVSGAACTLPEADSEARLTPAGQASADWQDLVQRAGRCVHEKNWRALERLGELIARRDVDSPWGAYFLSVAAENGSSGEPDLRRAMWMIDLAEKKSGQETGLFLYQRARLWLAMKETGKAVIDLERALALDPDLLDGHLYLGEIYLRDQEFDRAEPHFKAAHARRPVDYRALIGLAEVEIAKGDGDSAVRLLNQAIAEHAGQLQAWVRLGWAYENLQKNNELALATYRNLKTSVDSGSIKQKPDFDLVSKIKSLEESLKSNRLPAQASAGVADEKRRMK